MTKRLLLLLLLSACSHMNTVEPFVDTNITGPFVQIEGTVTYKTFEGGFWAIDSETGKTYEPLNLPGRFQQEGLAVEIEAKLREDLGSYRMVGPIIEIRSIRER